MKDLNLTVRFEQIDDNLAKAYVNERYVGRVKIHAKKNKLAFRCSANPFTNIVPDVEVFEHSTVKSLLEDTWCVRNLVPIVIRNYLRNTGYLRNLMREAA